MVIPHSPSFKPAVSDHQIPSSLVPAVMFLVAENVKSDWIIIFYNKSFHTQTANDYLPEFE